MDVHHLARADARRIAVRAQVLSAPRPTDLVDVVTHLTGLQNDPTAVVAPNADLVLWSRLGPAYRRAELDACLADGTLVEFRGTILPGVDLALYRAEMAQWPESSGDPQRHARKAEWVEVNAEFRDYVLYRLEDEGPLTWRDIPDRCAVPWTSSGWNDNRNVRMMIDALERRGLVAAAGLRGRDRLWDLAERVYPATPPVPLHAALRERARRRLVALGIARVKNGEHPNEPSGDVGEPAVIEGVRGAWRVDPDQLARPFRGRTALLSPLDRLVYDRRRMADLFEFDYQLEMYKPAARRRWGYFALPVLHGDRLVGKVDATADRTIGVLRVEAIHRDGQWARSVESGVRAELASLAHWLGLELALPG